MNRPRAARVEFDVRAPMGQRFAWLLDLFKRQRQIVMGVGVGGRQLQGSLVGLDRFLDAAGFVEDIAQVEVSQRITRIRLDRTPVMLFSLPVVLPVVKQSPDVNVRRRVIGIALKHLQINLDCLLLPLGVFFQGDAARKHFGDVGGSRGLVLHHLHGTAGHNFLVGREIEYELSGNRFEQLALMVADCYFRGGRRARLPKYQNH